ncbi:MAG: RNA polymerase sigma factor RpoD/SigA [Mycoplasmatales bacterium]
MLNRDKIETLTKKELNTLASGLKIHKYSSMNKKTLVDVIDKHYKKEIKDKEKEKLKKENKNNLELHSVSDLKELAKSKGITGISKDTKASIIKKIHKVERDEKKRLSKLIEEAVLTDVIDGYQITQLKEMAKSKGIEGINKYNKSDLVHKLKNIVKEEFKASGKEFKVEKKLEAAEIFIEDEVDTNKSVSYVSKQDEQKLQVAIENLIVLGKQNKSFVQDITVESELTSLFGKEYNHNLFLLVEKKLLSKNVEIFFTNEEFSEKIGLLRLQDEELAIDYNANNILQGVSKKQNLDLVRQFLSSINEYPLLSKEKEIEYAKSISICKEAGDKATPKMKKEAKYARDMLQLSNKRLVVSVAKRYIHIGLDLIDLIHEGTIGLIRAIEKYDYKTGYKFSTYAVWWVRQGITRAIADKARVIRVPVHMVETINKVTKVQRELVQQLGQEPTFEQIGLNTSPPMSKEQIEEIFKIARDPISLEKPVGEDHSSLEAFIEDEKSQKQDDYSEENELKEKILDIIDEIPDREGEVIKYRYGLYNLDTTILDKQITELENLIELLKSELIPLDDLEEYISYLETYTKRQVVKLKKRVKQNNEKFTIKVANTDLDDLFKSQHSDKIGKFQQIKDEAFDNNVNYLESVIDLLKEEKIILEKITELTEGIVKPLTLEEVGALFDVTRERIRQIESKGRRKLKSYAEKERLDLYI